MNLSVTSPESVPIHLKSNQALLMHQTMLNLTSFQFALVRHNFASHASFKSDLTCTGH